MRQLINLLLSVDIKIIYTILCTILGGLFASIIYITKRYHEAASWIEKISKENQDARNKIDTLEKEINSLKKLFDNVKFNLYKERDKISDIGSKVDRLMFIKMVENNQNLAKDEVVRNICDKKIIY